MEHWKDILESSNYQVSNIGRVKTKNYNHTKEEKILKLKDGLYFRVGLFINGKQKFFSVHRLQMEVFVPNPHNYPCINHKDENKHNNYIHINEDGTVDLEKSNLEWCTHEYNNSYGSRLERVSKKQLNIPSRSKHVLQYTLEGNLVAEYPSIHEASRQTGVARCCISDCCSNKQSAKTRGGFIWKYKIAS